MTSSDCYLTLDGENVVILYEDDSSKRFPLHTIENIVCFTYKGASPAFMGACAERNIGLSFFSPQGKFWAKTIGETQGNVLLRKEQYRISDNKDSSLSYAKNMILAKIYNGRWSLERTLRDHAMRVDVGKIKKISKEMHDGLAKIQKCEDIDTLRGIEGELASKYFSVFDDLIINQKDTFHFEVRTRRPPLDEVNALLSFAYTLLGNECANALSSIGLDPYVGFMHTDKPGRKSFALDLLEEFRPIIADRFILTMINKRIIRKEDFEKQENGAVLLNENGRSQFINAWQMRKKEIITHPFLKEKIQWGLVPYAQGLLLARTIRGDLDQYPPFLWK